MAVEPTGITIDGSAIQQLMVKAILETWSEEQRDNLVAQAIQNLFLETHNTSFGKSTVIDLAMKKGAEEAATKAVTQLLEQPEYKMRIVQVVREEFEKVFAEDPSDGGSPIRRAIYQGLRKELEVGRW